MKSQNLSIQEISSRMVFDRLPRFFNNSVRKKKPPVDLKKKTGFLL